MNKRLRIKGNIGQDIIKDTNDNFKTLFDDFEFPNALKEYIKLSDVGDDKGISVLSGQFSVGSRSDPRETVLGSGDSQPFEYAFHAHLNNTTGDSVTGAIDISEEVSSDSNSSVPFYGGITTGHYIMVGDSHPYYGAKLKWASFGNVDPSKVKIEYLSTSGVWLDVKFMITDANSPYDQYAHRINTAPSGVEQLFVGNDPNDPLQVWNPVPFTINGVEVTKFWTRFVIEDDIIEDPIIEQIKAHSSSFEIEGDGTTSYRGNSRYPIVLQSGLDKVVTNAAANPSNENVQYSPGIIALYQDNEFRNGAIDSLLLIQNINEGMDTSMVFYLSINWYAKGDNGGQIELGLEVVHVDANVFNYDGTTNAVEVFKKTTVLDGVDDNRRNSTVFAFFVDDLDSRSGFVLNLYRDATAGNVEDTHDNSVIITNQKLSAYAWKP